MTDATAIVDTATAHTVPVVGGCSILTDGHRAPATHTVVSSVFGSAASPQGRRFCRACAVEEVAYLADFHAGDSIAVYRREQSQPSTYRPVRGTWWVDDETGEPVLFAPEVAA